MLKGKRLHRLLLVAAISAFGLQLLPGLANAKHSRDSDLSQGIQKKRASRVASENKFDQKHNPYARQKSASNNNAHNAHAASRNNDDGVRYSHDRMTIKKRKEREQRLKNKIQAEKKGHVKQVEQQESNSADAGGETAHQPQRKGI